MDNSHLGLYKKYVQARNAFVANSTNFINKLSSGIKSNKNISIYNSISAWLDFIGNHVPEPISTKGKSPDPISFKIFPSAYAEQAGIALAPVHIFIVDKFGVRTKLATGFSFVPGLLYSTFNMYMQMQNSTIGLYFSYDQASEVITVTFPKTSKYNGGYITAANAYLGTVPYPITKVYIKNGADPVSTSLNLTNEEITHVHKILDVIAMELDIIYSDAAYNTISNNNEVKTYLDINNKLSLTTENGRPLEV
tara:strand:- start:183 stop:935 length:753 start_codon:yes stop_codon:yes gene_type:complete